jgi:TolB-like protein
VRGISQAIGSRLASYGGFELVHGDRALLPTGDAGAIADVARTLDAELVLTGSVRVHRPEPDAVERFDLAVQLLRAADGTTLWGDSTQVTLTDLFALEDRIAREVAAAVPDAEYRLAEMRTAEAPTDNRAAYRYYLRATGLSRRALPLSEEVRDAYLLLQQAVDLDPTFAQAWAELSVVLQLQERWELEEVAWTAGEALERALSLAPDDPEVLIALGTYRTRNAAEALDGPLAGDPVEPLLRALEQRPNSVRALVALVPALQHHGLFELAVDAGELAVRRAPTDAAALGAATRAHNSMRHWGRAEMLAEKLAAVEPERYVHWHGRARMRLMAEGEPERVLEWLETAPTGLVPEKVFAELDAYARDPEATLARARPMIEQLGLEAFMARHWPLAMYTGFAARATGEDELADRMAEIGLRQSLGMLNDHPEHFHVLLGLAYSYALGGRESRAVATLCRILAAQPSNVGVTRARTEELAGMLALSGRVEAVLPLIERLMQWNYGLTPLNRHELALHPRWDALRGDPAFEALVETAPVAEEWDGDVPVGSVVLVDRIRQAPRSGDAGIPAVESVCSGLADPASQPSDSGGGRASMAAPIRPGLARAPSPPGSRAR